MINKVRRLLIQIGKILPFVICGLLLFGYAETLFAVITSRFLDWNGIVIPNTPISFFIGRYFEYNLQMLVVLCIISIAIETCVWNKLTCAYLGIVLLQKHFLDFEMEESTICVICTLNIIVCAVLIYKGFKMLKLC